MAKWDLLCFKGTYSLPPGRQGFLLCARVYPDGGCVVVEGGWLLVAAGVGGDGWKRERRAGGSIKPACCHY